MDLDTHENPFIYFTTILDLFLQFCSKDVTIYTVEFTFFLKNPITIKPKIEGFGDYLNFCFMCDSFLWLFLWKHFFICL